MRPPSTPVRFGRVALCVAIVATAGLVVQRLTPVEDVVNVDPADLLERFDDYNGKLVRVAGLVHMTQALNGGVGHYFPGVWLVFVQELADRRVVATGRVVGRAS